MNNTVYEPPSYKVMSCVPIIFWSKDDIHKHCLPNNDYDQICGYIVKPCIMTKKRILKDASHNYEFGELIGAAIFLCIFCL